MKKKMNKDVEGQKVKLLSFANLKAFMETKEYLDARERLFRDINSRVLQVDRSVFKKGPKERIKAINIKLQWKKEMRRFYGREWKKFQNTPETLVD